MQVQVGLIPHVQTDAQTVQTRVLRRLLLEFVLYLDDDDGDDGAPFSDQDLFLVCTNNYFNLPSECRSINCSPCW